MVLAEVTVETLNFLLKMFVAHLKVLKQLFRDKIHVYRNIYLKGIKVNDYLQTTLTISKKYNTCNA